MAAALLALLLIRLASVQGVWRPVRVVGGSMAGSFYGPHYRLACADCRFSFRYGVEHPPLNAQAVCPNCGYRYNEVEPSVLKDGQQVFIDRLAFSWRKPRRWEAAALYPPGEKKILTFKRIVALPEETASIRNGDVYIDGQIARKSLEELRPMAILVHDDRWRAQKRDAEQDPARPRFRWSGSSANTGWRPNASGYEYRPTQIDAASTFDWLEYRHYPCYAGPPIGSTPSAIDDSYGYNQGLARSRLFDVKDVIAACRIFLVGRTRIALQAHYGPDVFAIHFREGEPISLHRNGRQVFESPRSLENARHPMEVEFGLCDRQVLLSINRRLIFCVPFAASSVVAEHAQRDADVPSASPLRIGAQPQGDQGIDGGKAAVDQLRLYRDVYYLDPHNSEEHWDLQRPLGRREYLLLGDNSPASRDGRHWERPASREDLVGKVVVSFPLGIVKSDWNP